MGSVTLDIVTYKPKGNSTAKMNRQAAALGVLVVVIATVSGLPDHRPHSNGFHPIHHPTSSHGLPPQAPPRAPTSSYGPPPQAPPRVLTSTYGPPPQAPPRVLTSTY